MAQVQYKTSVAWDLSLIDIGYADSMITSGLKGLAINAVKITTGAPQANSGRFIPGALITNSVDGTTYENTGSTNAPAWTLLATGGSLPTVQTDELTIVANHATLSATPLAILSVSSNGGTLAPGTGNDYVLTGTDINTLNIASGPLLVIYFK